MRRALLLLSLTAAVALDCSRPRSPSTEGGSATAAALSVPFPRVWEAVLGEDTAIPACLIFDPDSTARVVGAFAYLNPLRWRYRADSGVLRLTLPRPDSGTIVVFSDHAQRGYVQAFDPHAGIVTYRFSPDSVGIYLAGWRFFRLGYLEQRKLQDRPLECARDSSAR